MTLSTGDRLAERSFGPITRTDIVKYQGASGDFNPIHHDEEFAKKAGFPTVFSVGMLQASYVGTYLTEILGAENVRGLKVRFVEQVWPGDTITCNAVVADIVEDEPTGERRATIEVTATRQNGGTAISGIGTFVV